MDALLPGQRESVKEAGVQPCIQVYAQENAKVNTTTGNNSAIELRVGKACPRVIVAVGASDKKKGKSVG